MFWAYAALMGLSLGGVLLVYTGTSVARVFYVSAATFAGMSLYGYSTGRDLSRIESFLMMGLVGIVLASIVNIFVASSVLQFAVSGLGVLLFTGLTAYDTQRIKGVYHSGGFGDDLAKAGLMGALTLYLDFINLFLMLLQLTGTRRDR
jgi:uncharacterized protein